MCSSFFLKFINVKKVSRSRSREIYLRSPVRFRALLRANLYEAAYWIASQWLVGNDKTELQILFCRCWNRLLIRDTCSQTWKFFREARGSLSSLLISNQVHRGPMNNPDDISPTLNRHTSARMDVVTHRSTVLSRYFVIIFSARLPLEFGLQLETTARHHRSYKSKFGDSSFLCTLTLLYG